MPDIYVYFYFLLLDVRCVSLEKWFDSRGFRFKIWDPGL